MSENFPYNKLNREAGEKKLAEENFKRITLSFYKYVIIKNASELRNELYLQWEKLDVLGRVYLAEEGINAQISVPEHHFSAFETQIKSIKYFKNIPFKIALEEPVFSFYKLTIKVRKQIVADGLSIDDYDITNVGNHLNAKQWNEAIDKGATVVDMRNHYESEIGFFKGAIKPDVDTFRESLQIIDKELDKNGKDRNYLMYCTGGIRCEKASAYLKYKGIQNVFQLEGGIIEYIRQVKDQNLENNFLGKNFVFDERLGERVSDEIVSNCHQCGAPCDTHVNCANESCHLLFIQCDDCKKQMNNCCSDECKKINALPYDEQKLLRKGKGNSNQIFKKGRSTKLKYKID